MAAQIAASLFFRPEGYSIGEIKFDLILRETHEFRNTITSHKIQDGRDVSDHIRNELRNGSFTGQITNYSIYIDGVENRALDVLEQLKTLWQNTSDTYTLTLVVDVIENIVIQKISVNKDGQTGDKLDFDITFRQIEKVNIKTVNIGGEFDKKAVISKTLPLSPGQPGAPLTLEIEALL